ncbi:UNVERIFIED_CONTAM: Retrovirus-related Pol polyprotein from transposon TNT 1-94 [Sesamum radiatum]|uniref:Retrovirus-related Pol polyprotein from transposon TNT 1-94 n=1 Tax=Sesamum radiatum TaxID=300843 RepID=A0AAW2L3C3_SESRA
MTVANKMRTYGEDMQDVKVVEKILRSLTEKFNYVVCSIEESKDIDALTVDELQSSLIVHEQKFQRHRGEEQALKVTHDRGRGRGRGAYRGRGRGRGRASFNKETVECYRCHKLGHFQYECSENIEANYAEFGKEDEMLLMAHTELNGARKEDAWFLDSGCSNHMCGDPTMFSELDDGFRHSVKLGNNTKMSVMGIGTVNLLLNGVSHIVSENVYLANSITSFSASRSMLSHEAESLTQLWHRRYGHLNYKGLRILLNKEMVRGLPHLSTSNVTCNDCINGKQHRDPISKKSNWRASQKLELIHADICGPITPISNSNKRYILLFIDDYIEKLGVHFLTEKSEAFNSFKCFKTMVEKETGLSIKCLRTDRGGEFNSNEFNKFCIENGIKRQLTTAYTPQQNGVAERKNRTIMNMVRSMLSDKSVPKTFWPEAVNWSIYVLNRCPTLAVKDVTPEEAWSGLKPSVEHFRVFGCIAHESKGYRLFDPVAKRIIVSRDVIFEEGKQWDWDESLKNHIIVDLEWGENKEVISENEDGVSTDEEVSDEEIRRDDANSSEVEERVRRPPRWMSDYVSGDGLSENEDKVHIAQVVSNDPLHFEQAVKSANWRMAMDNEIKSIEKNKTWTLTELPVGTKKIGVKWVYKTKYNENGKIDKYKARLVAKGYSQQHGIDYTEVFAPVARMDTVRMIIALAAQKDWKIFQLDVKSAFLHGELREDVYVEQPRGYEKKESEHLVYKLHKALYGLKQAPRAWFSRIEAHFSKEGFQKCYSEQTLFTKKNGEGKIIIVLQKSDGIFICQRNYAIEILEKFGMIDSNSVGSPIVPGFKVSKDDDGVSVDDTYYKQLVGSLMYLIATRPDMMFATCLISRYMAKPKEIHLQTAKRLLRYLKGTVNYGIYYKKEGELLAFTDSDYAGDVDDRKSTSGYVFMMSSGAVSWCSKKQPIVTLSTTEAEFVAATVCACQGIWMKRILKELGYFKEECITVMCDNSSTIKLSKNPVMHGRSKHIDVRFHFLRNLVKDGALELVYCGSQDQVADIMTKPLKIEVFQKHRKMLGVCEISKIN